ncbi:MAG: hydrolase [Caldibacillus debilis]|uniref:Hydrolase n=1 Tax=Caldibacillus debilis TaxID=301148 RepID=A0A3E0K7B2_9BACI|nr:hydrolase [Caldibacillus debilis]OUM84898.1 MAG: hydrolase [Caldibacillus debilis]REJ25601.1 MAG: hydrolase [Caldibacillus debilis]REJ30624.1 MAG: hydrolase [Caldibacillus debilis]
MEKKTYYVDLASGSISQSRSSSAWNYEIEATDEEIIQLRKLFDLAFEKDGFSFIRAHVPYVPYHYDRENDAYDRLLAKIFAMLHHLGDEAAKKHIESLGILGQESAWPGED